MCSVNALGEIGLRLNWWFAAEHHGWRVLDSMEQYGHGMYRFETGDGPVFFIQDSGAALLLSPKTDTVIFLTSPTRADFGSLAFGLWDLLKHG